LYSPKEHPNIDDQLPVIPSSAKLDVEKIKVDILKYHPFIQPLLADDWQTFCKNDFSSVYQALVRGSYCLSNSMLAKAL